MLLNVRDKRKRPYRWRNVNAIIEDTWNDNGVADADQARKDAPHQMTYDQRRDISVTEAIEWAMACPAEVTLFLYDLGGGFEKTKSLKEWQAVRDNSQPDAE